jgi:aryl carrier-like protein
MDDGFSVTLACLSNIMDLESLDHEISRLEAFLATVVSQPNSKAVTDVSLDGRKLPLCNDVPTTSIAPRREIDHLPPALVNVLISVAKCSVDRLDPDSSVAAIGIDSITAVQLSAKCREAGIALIITDIVACRTIGDLATRVVEVEGQPIARPTNPDHLVPEVDYQAVVDEFLPERRGDLTVSRAASGMKWLICTWQRRIDPERLCTSWTEFTARHPILRSTFVSTKYHLLAMTKCVGLSRRISCHKLLTIDGGFNIVSCRRLI